MNEANGSSPRPAYAGRRVVILGAARQGKALTRWLVGQGARVVLSDAQANVDVGDLGDLAGLRTHFGGHPLALLDDCELLCLSGGVPIDLPIVLEARRRGVPLSNDAQIFFEQCPAPIIGITGSAGKTTTTTLVGHMLRRDAERDGRSVWVGGNIGNPLIGDAARIAPDDRVVMELSSFQLELMTCSPRIACITNITPNHLDRHGTMEAYIAAKQHIVDFQTADDVRVLNADDPVTAAMAAGAGRVVWFSLRREPDGEGAWLDAAGDLRLRIGGVEDVICHRSRLQLMGDHNVANVLAAAAVCRVAGVEMAAVRAVAEEFRGVEHRLQLVGEIDGVRYYDDSIATAPERLAAGLKVFEAPVVLLCGGRDKHLPWEEAAALMLQRCRHVVLFGELGPMVADVLAHLRAATPDAPAQWTIAPRLADAFVAARRIARPGDVVLLSPGGTSFDEFRDFAQRGAVFAAMVRGAAQEEKEH